jgi:phosphoglycerate dehydrogenase-like enzyme
MSDKPVVIVDPNFRTMDELFSPEDIERLHAMATVVWGRDELMPMDEFMAALPEAVAVISAEWRYGDVLPQAKKLRAYFSVAGAFPLTMDHQYCFDHHIRVISISPVFARQVAEMCVGMAIDACREISYGDRLFRANKELYLHAGNTTTFMLYDQPVGFVGYGSIPRELHKLLQPFGVSVSAYDPWLTDGALRSLGVQPLPLKDLLETSRFIFVLPVPTKENRAMLNREMLGHVQQDAVVVLMSRAHVVDFDALSDYVMAGRFRLATDVLPTEPLAADHPIRHADNAVLSAHRAGSLKQGMREAGPMILDDLEAVLKNLPPVRLPVLQPELAPLYATIEIPRGEDD